MPKHNEMHEANRKRWDAGAEGWAKRADSRGLWRRCPDEPELVLSERERAHLADLAGKRVCVLGSGDNQVVFALAGLGALVTSVDISQNQLDIAARRALAIPRQACRDFALGYSWRACAEQFLGNLHPFAPAGAA